MHRPIVITFTLAFTLACTSEPATDDEAGTTTSPDSTDDDGSSDESTDGSSTSSTSTSTTSDDDPTTDETTDDGLFLPGNDILELGCDIIAQDCPQGEKCVPYSSTEEPNWDSTKCVPVMGDHAVGEACTYDGVVESTDDCDESSWCFSDTCHAFCGGSWRMPECPEMSSCSINDGGTITICIPTCDPVAQDCPEGDGCYWASGNFWCVAASENVMTGEVCGYTNDCQVGNQCVDAQNLPECAGPSCCTSFCDLGVGDSQCASIPGTTCEPFYGQGEAPPEYEHVGMCILSP